MSKILPTGEVTFSIADIQTRYYNSVAIGYESGKKLENYDNVFIGQKAGYYSTTTSNCIFIGNNAGRYENNVDGFNNIIFGDDNNSKIVNNIISFGHYNSTDDNCITIGRNVNNKGNNNLSYGLNNNLKGTNIINYGNYNNIITSEVFYQNFNNSNITSNNLINRITSNYNNIKYYLNDDKINNHSYNILINLRCISNNCNLNINLYNNDNLIANNNKTKDILNINDIITLEYGNNITNKIELDYTNLIINEVYIIDNNYNISNIYNIAYGCNINIIGFNNIGIGNNFTITGDNSIIIGNNYDNPIGNSIIIGNDNFKDSFANNAIVIGNNSSSNIIYDDKSSPIIIGNNINNSNFKFSLNIKDIICKNDKLLLFNSPTAVGYTFDEIDKINLNSFTNSSLLIKNGLKTDNVSIINSNNFSINILPNEQLTKNINYTLPILPDDINSVFLTTDIYGNLIWNEVGYIYTNNMSVDTIVVNNIIANNISGDGNNLTNINISDKNTNNLKEGNVNLYYTDVRACNLFANKISLITIDNIKEGTSNLYMNNNYIDESFFRFINKINSDYIKSGNSNYYLNSNIFTQFFNLSLRDITTDNIKEGSSNLYYTRERSLNDIETNLQSIILNNITSDSINEGNTNLYYHEDQIYNDFYSIINSINVDLFQEGNINKFYNETSASALISNIVSGLYLKNNDSFNQFLNSKTSDNIIEGVDNLYFTQNRFNESINNITTDNIIQGTSNLYFTPELFYSNIVSNITLDDIKQGTSNTYIINNTLDSDLYINGILYASNIIIRGSNLVDLYDSYFSNINSNNLLLTNYYLSSNININNSSNLKNINLNIYDNNKPILINKRGPPLCVIGSNVGMNNITPRYNLDVNGIVNSTYFRGEGSLISNINLKDKTTDNLNEGTSNLYLTYSNINNLLNYSNLYFNDIKMKGTLYTSSIVVNNSGNSGNSDAYSNLATSNSINFIGGSNTLYNLNLDLRNNNGLTINHTAPPFIIVGNNVGVNNMTPQYNLHVKGYTCSDYFVGNGSYLTNVNIESLNIGGLTNNQGNINFIVSNCFSNNLKIIGDLTVTKNIILNGSLIPNATNIYDIGTSSSKWRNMYIYNSINLGNLLLKTDINNYLSILEQSTNIFSGLKTSTINIYNSSLNYTTLQVKDDGSLLCYYNGNVNNKAISYNDLSNQLIFIKPLVKNNTNNNITLDIDENKLLIDNDKLTLKLTKKIFNFTLIQNSQYPNLWYYSLPISTYSSFVTIDTIQYNIFNIKSWTANNNIFDSFVWINRRNNNKRLINKSAITPDSINLNNNIFKSQGWQTDDNDCNNLVWFSSYPDTIYNILEDIIS